MHMKKIVKKINSLLNFGFVTIYVVHEMFEFHKNYLNHLKDNIFNCFNRIIINFNFFRKHFFNKI